MNQTYSNWKKSFCIYLENRPPTITILVLFFTVDEKDMPLIDRLFVFLLLALASGERWDEKPFVFIMQNGRYETFHSFSHRASRRLLNIKVTPRKRRKAWSSVRGGVGREDLKVKGKKRKIKQRKCHNVSVESWTGTRCRDLL